MKKLGFRRLTFHSPEYTIASMVVGVSYYENVFFNKDRELTGRWKRQLQVDLERTPVAKT